jgi:hypothetical protein
VLSSFALLNYVWILVFTCFNPEPFHMLECLALLFVCIMPESLQSYRFDWVKIERSLAQ